LLSFGAIIAGLLFVIAHSAIQPSYAPAPTVPPVVSEGRPGRPPSGTTVIAPQQSTRLSGIASLACQAGPNTGRVFPVGSGFTRLGRGSQNEVDFGEGDDMISRSHAEVSYDGRDFYVQDVGSRNGTYVDGTIVPRGSKRKLRDGAELKLGPITTLVFRSERDTRLASD
jgi:pSer/pThr/pTyr-binding forkhead associated (FHA) protein